MTHLIEHFIQRDILRKLSRSGELSFSELQSDGMENGVFAYHLKALVSAKLVTHCSSKYRLSEEGTRYVTQVSRTNLDIQLQPKIFGFLIVENEKGEYLLHRRAAKPFLHRYTFPGGALLFDETIDGLVQRQLLEKVGENIALEDKGIASLRLGEKGQTLSHTYAHLLYGKTHSSLPIRAKDARFTPEWIDIHNISKAEILPDVVNILDAIVRSDGYFFLSLHLTDQTDLVSSITEEMYNS